MTLLWLYWSPALATAALIFYLSHQTELPGPLTPFPDWVAHGVEYGFFTLTLAYATTRGFARGLRARSRVAAAVFIASLYGVSDELHQSFVPGRDPAVLDWLADTVGALIMACVILASWRWMAGSENRV